MLSVTLLCLSVSARSEELASLRDDVEAFKQDARGPYQAIRWFCPDGSVLPAREPCPVAGGLQHALVKERVDAIAAEHGIYLGQILAGTAYEEFLDASRGHARLKQYQLERYLRIVDDGWIHRRARYYRGAVQAEDELAWGRRFLEWLVAEDAVLEQQFFLVRQIAKDLPHAADTHGMTRARVLAKDIATVVPEFMNLRVKIHGRPDAEDAARVRAFRRDQRALPASARAQLWELIAELDEVYQRTTLSRLERYLDAIRADSPVSSVLVQILERRSSADPSISSLSELLWQIRSTIRDAPTGERLALIDLSNDVEAILVRVAGARNARTPRELIDENYILARAAVGCGFIELWEWEMLRESLRVTSNEWTSFELIESADAARRAVAWSTGMVTALYGSVVDQFSQFEPLSRGLIDERIRASILLRFGEAADHLDALAASASGLTH